MNRLSARAISLVMTMTTIPATTIPAWAQQAPAPDGPGRYYGYGHMWGDGWGWHPGMIFGPLLVFLLLLAIAMVATRLFCPGRHGFCGHGGRGRWHGAMDILEERLAKGEIGKEEFEEKRKLLGR